MLVPNSMALTARSCPKKPLNGAISAVVLKPRRPASVSLRNTRAGRAFTLPATALAFASFAIAVSCLRLAAGFGREMILHSLDARDRLRRHDQCFPLGRIGDIAAQFDTAIPHDDIDLRKRRPGLAIIDGEQGGADAFIVRAVFRLAPRCARSALASRHGLSDHADESALAHHRDQMHMPLLDQ